MIALLTLFLALHAAPARVSPLSGLAFAQASQGSSAGVTTDAVTTPPSGRAIASYTLPSDEDRKARHLAEIRFWGQIATLLYSVIVFVILLRVRVGPVLRDMAERLSQNHFLQAAVFGPAFFAILALAGIPTDAGEHWVSRWFGLSVEGWGSWLWDWTKEQLLGLLLATFLIAILYLVMRKSPRRWWLYFWLFSLPLTVFLVFLQPIVVDPLFHKFEPLGQKDPALAQALEGMVQRAGEDIPIDRMYWMGAAEKTKELNAYVTGIGASKRIVVWDTTIAKMNTPETVFVVGHEMGHYVLHHIWKGMAASAVGSFVLFYFGYRMLVWLVEKRGEAWGIRGVDDWASLPLLLLALTVLGFIAQPLGNGLSRYVEHQADQYGLEVTHGLTPDSSQVAAQAFQVLGEVDMDDPAPNPFDVFLFYSHPPIPDRLRFALIYNPWANSGHGKFVK